MSTVVSVGCQITIDLNQLFIQKKNSMEIALGVYIVKEERTISEEVYLLK